MPQTLNLMVGVDHPVPIEPQGGTATVTNVSGGTLFYADNPQVSATTNQGSISSGQSQAFTGQNWMISASVTTAQVTYSPAASTTSLPGLAIGRGGCTIPIGTHAHIGYISQSNGTDTSTSYRFFQPLTDVTATTILPIFGNWIGGTTSGGSPYFFDSDAPNAITIAAAIETSDGNIVPFTFNGQHTITLDPAQHAFLAVPDHPINFGSQVSAVDKFSNTLPLTGVWMRTFVTCAAAAKWPLNIGTLGNLDNLTNGTGADLTLPGSGNVTGGATSQYYGPCVVLGRPHTTGSNPILLLSSDSIFDGFPDDFHSPFDGPIARACRTLRLPMVKCSKGSETAGDLTASGRRFRSAFWDGCTHALIEMGTNDGVLNGAGGVTTLQTRLNSHIDFCHSMGMKVAITTIPPRTTSTDSWATTTNQTPVSGSQITFMAQMNQWLRAGSSRADAVLDVNTLFMSSTDSGLWTPGGTSDGVHPTDAISRGSLTSLAQAFLASFTAT